MSSINHLLFDCDGVLVDTEYVAAIKMTAALQNLGADITVDYYLQHLSGSTFSSIVQRYLPGALTEAEALNLINDVEDQVSAEVKPISGVTAMLAALSPAKSVVSNSSARTVKHALKATGIDGFFGQHIFSSEYVARPKPAPDVYLQAMATLALPASEILVVEDSLSGARAALAAGLRVVGFTGASHILPGHEKQLRELGVRAVARNMPELTEQLAGQLS